jgi:carbamoyltransferase
MRILGVNSVYHELAAALVVDGEVVVAAEEERFNRRKHGAEARVDNADELPLAAIRFCLDAGGVDAEALDAICYSFDPQLRRREHRPDPYAARGGWGDVDGERTFLEGVHRVPARLSAALGCDVSGRFRWIPHHLAHAASAFYTSGFDRAGILVVDGIGEYATVGIGYGDGDRLTIPHRIFYPHSLGFLWEKMSTFLGFGEYDACKVMGLAAYGDADVFRAELESIVSVCDDGFRVADDVLQFRRRDFDGLSSLFGPPTPGLGKKHRDLAAALQAVTDDVALALTRAVHDRFPCDSLCIAGGVGLNCHANWVVKEEGPFERIYIPSAPHDAGTAIGAALYHHHASRPRRAPAAPRARSAPYLGPQFTEAEIEQALRAYGVSATRPRSIEHAAARLVADGNVVGWFQGRMEFGPRALGNRSLLADPRTSETRERLNRKVKHRETFRPFAPTVLAEHANDWFDLRRSSDSYAFMSFACPVRSDRAAAVPAVVHEDGTARVQIVDSAANAQFHGVISEFHELTGVPLVLNTSFNDSEPIVCSPTDALATFLGTRIDALALGPYLVERS